MKFTSGIQTVIILAWMVEEKESGLPTMGSYCNEIARVHCGEIKEKFLPSLNSLFFKEMNVDFFMQEGDSSPTWNDPRGEKITLSKDIKGVKKLVKEMYKEEKNPSMGLLSQLLKRVLKKENAFSPLMGESYVNDELYIREEYPVLIKYTFDF